MIKLVIVAALVIVVAGRSIDDPQPNLDLETVSASSNIGTEEVAATTRVSVHGSGKYKPYQRDGTKVYNEKPHPYDFTYAVKDSYSGNDFGQGESGDGYGNVQGQYYVRLPDGRVQRVTYTADHNSGYVADVTYEGVARYPDEHYDDTHKGDYKEGHKPVHKTGYKPTKNTYKKTVY